MRRSVLLIGLVVLVLVGGALFVVLPGEDGDNDAALKSITGAGLSGHRLALAGSGVGSFAVTGGHLVSEVLPDGVRGLRSTLGRPEPYVANATAFPPQFSTWLNDYAAGKFLARPGSFTRVSSTGTVAEVSEFTDALLTEVVVPGCKPGTTGAAEFSYTLAPSATSRLTGGALPTVPTSAALTINQCRVQSPTLDLSSASEVSSFQLSWDPPPPTTTTDGVPTLRSVSTTMTPRQIRLSVSMLDGRPSDLLRQWADDALVRGNLVERDVSLLYLSATGTETARFNMGGCGPYRTGGKVINGAAHLTVFLYCERLIGTTSVPTR